MEWKQARKLGESFLLLGVLLRVTCGLKHTFSFARTHIIFPVQPTKSSSGRSNALSSISTGKDLRRKMTGVYKRRREEDAGVIQLQERIRQRRA
jgi:hypothetical protein